MLLTIHNLPTRIQHSDVKELIISKCGLKEVILDNLENEGSGMRVTVGVIAEEDAALLVRKINGLYFKGQQLYVEDIRQKKESEQPYRTSKSLVAQYQTQQLQPGYLNAQMQATLGMLPMSNYAMYQPMSAVQTVQNSFMAYGTQFGGPAAYEYAQPYAVPGAMASLGRRKDAQDSSPRSPEPWPRDAGGRDFNDHRIDRSRDRVDRPAGFDRSHDWYDSRSRSPNNVREADTRSDRRSGYEPTIHSGPVYYSRDNSRGRASETRDDRQRNANPKKRRWEDTTKQSYDKRPEWPPQNNRREPRPARSGPPPAHLAPGPATGPPHMSASRLFRGSKIRGENMIIYEIAHNLGIAANFHQPNLVKTGLRKVVTPRVREIVGTETLPAEEILRRYRELYPKSEDFDRYADIKRCIAENEVTTSEKHGGEHGGKALKKGPFLQIPCYQGGDNESRDQEEQRKKETLEPYPVDAELRQAIDEEIELIEELFEKEFKNSESELEKTILAKINQAECIDQCKKLLTYHASKRLTDGGLKLVRIRGHPMLPLRSHLEAYLQKYNCLSLKKTAKTSTYVATFGSYKTIDQLCAKDLVVVGDVLVSFEHEGVGPRKATFNRAFEKITRKKLIDSLKDNSEVNLLSKDWQSQIEKDKSEAVSGLKLVGIINTVPIKGKKDVAAIDQDITVNKEVTEDNNDFLHEDFKVIDEVRESDNDDAVNDTSNEGSGGNAWAEVIHDWDHTQDDWDDVTGKVGDNESDVETSVAENIDDEENVTNLNEDDEEDNIDMGNIDIDDIDEEDLEDY